MKLARQAADWYTVTMQFAPSSSKRARAALTAALSSVLEPGEDPVLGMTLVHVGRMQEWLVITRSRLIGINKAGTVVLSVDPSTVAGFDISKHMQTLTLHTGTERVKLGNVYVRDQDTVRDALIEVCPALHPVPPAMPSAPPVDAPAPRVDVPAPPVGSLADELTKLAALRQQGALTEAQFELAKAAVIGADAGDPPLTAPSAWASRSQLLPPAPSKSRKRGQVREMQRVCRIDGTVWFVPLDVARHRPPNRMLTGGLKMQEFAATGFLTGGAAASTQLGRIDAMNARSAAARQCPACGSQSFTEAVVRH